MLKFYLAIFLFILLNQSLVFGWGSTGHRVTGEIAEKSLPLKARQQISKILRGQSLAEVSTWADEIRSDSRYQFSIPWHFVEIPIGTKYDPKNASPKGDLIAQIQIMLEILKGKRPPLKINDMTIAKPEALKFLVHFVGDLHQPFHVGNGRDRGAHTCQVKWFGQNELRGKPWNLHSVWDEGIIDSLQLSYTELTQFILNKKLTPQEQKRIQGGSPLDWANESRQIQVQLYPNIKVYTVEIPEPAYCNSQKEDAVKKKIMELDIPNLGYDYRYEVVGFTKERLREAGLRIADLLNKIYGR